MADLAAVACLSRFELTRRRHAETGLTPHAYEVNLRISRARALVAEGVMPAAVAAECGFADQPHLTRTFKRAAPFLISGISAIAGPAGIGKDYRDADDRHCLPLLVQPVLVFEAGAGTLRVRAERREVPIAIYTTQMFTTGNDADNRAAVRVVATADLDLAGVGLRAPHRDADAILRGVHRHP